MSRLFGPIEAFRPVLALCALVACGGTEGARDTPPTLASAPPPTTGARPSTPAPTTGAPATGAPSDVRVDAFADVQVLRYEVPGWEGLSARQRVLLYHLSEAAHAGRDIIYDQNYRHNLAIRRTLEAVYRSETARSQAGWAAMHEYLKQVWFAHGIHHHYSRAKFTPGFSRDAFAAAVRAVDPGSLPLQPGETVDALIDKLTPVLFDPAVDAVQVNLGRDVDKLAASATNLYRDVTEAEAVAFYRARIDPADPTPVSHGLNSRLVKENGRIVEEVWKVGGLYGAALEQVVQHLEAAIAVAENDKQRAAWRLLVDYYRTGDLAKFDAYNKIWVTDVDSRIDLIHGFIEVYSDPLGYRGAYEAVLSIRDLKRSRRIATIGGQAQWFEDNSPIMAAHKKKKVVGISAKVITVVTEAGDAAPATPIGINLPNAAWIRKNHGSKSVFLGNIVDAYQVVRASSGVLEEFAASTEEVIRYRKHGGKGYTLKVDMHEVIGHASGQLNPGVGTPKETLKSYASTLEEARADLVALYYVMDQKLVDMGLMESLDVGRAAYDGYIRNGMLVQLARVAPGADLEEAHMRNRQLISKYAFEKGKDDGVIERVTRDGKTFFVVRDYARLRDVFGELLREIQRIKSEGDYEAGKALVETYGVEVEDALHREVLARYAKLGTKPYSGFVQPRLTPVRDGDRIVDAKISYPTDYTAQMLRYGEAYGHLPTYN
ncbi:MAG: dihydrofolate reductase [Myxococcota bacterium]